MIIFNRKPVLTKSQLALKLRKSLSFIQKKSVIILQLPYLVFGAVQNWPPCPVNIVDHPGMHGDASWYNLNIKDKKKHNFKTLNQWFSTFTPPPTPLALTNNLSNPLTRVWVPYPTYILPYHEKTLFPYKCIQWCIFHNFLTFVTHPFFYLTCYHSFVYPKA